MKFVEFKKGITIPITNEEQDIFRKCSNDGSLDKRKLDEREQEIANQLVIKNMLVRKRVNDSIIYKPQASAKYC
jgi:hypothetical protein|tara:strand:+ start:252 stop:473 length:222 start_codon:yes stop_codon:yes gene_type:complete